MVDITSNKWKEECGVFGVFSRTEDVSMLTYLGLYALQHRGQESAGIAVTDGAWMDVTRDMGLVNEVFRHQLPHMENQYIAIGHVRYSTTGSSLLSNTQPLIANYSGGKISLAHNGNLTNAAELRRYLEEQGTIFQTSIDTEVIVNLIARSRKSSIEEKIIESVQQVKGAFCLAIMTENKLIAVRDPQGFRPLCIGKTEEGSWIISSESCGLDVVGAEFIRDVEPGEMVVMGDDGLKSYKYTTPQKKAACVFEYIYFARPDSVIDGQSVHAARFMMGRMLARESKFKGDIVISVPDSGNTAATGFAYESGIPFCEGLIKNRYIGRTFIQPTQKKRDTAVRLKLNAISEAVRGKSVIMVDDSIVRGTTCANIIKMLKKAGAKEVHVRISSPPFLHPCYFGTDVPSNEQLIAHSHTTEQIREMIGADSLGYMEVDKLKNMVGDLAYCDACFTGNYPMEVPGRDVSLAFE